MPALVATKMIRHESAGAANWMVVPVDVFARQAVESLGRWPCTTGCVQHDLQAAVCKLLPFDVVVLILRQYYKWEAKRFAGKKK